MPSNVHHALNSVRVDHIGSFLRPDSLKKAFQSFALKNIDQAEMEGMQNAAIQQVMARQRQAGLPVLSDGEFRRLRA